MLSAGERSIYMKARRLLSGEIGFAHGLEPVEADADGLESLTERELQLARLVVDRKTNPEIAAELFLSQKTVETHLRNIFRKVGVSSRVELARAVERADRESG